MATTYKSLSTNDIVTTKTLLHEAIPITGTIVSGTYIDGATEKNIKNYTHGMFQSVYDYPYLSSSANHIFDVAVGFHADSSLSGTSAGHVQVSKKMNMYNQMAQVLMGYDENGNIRKFDEDGDLTGGTKIEEVLLINFARLLSKDEIKKGSLSLELGVNQAYDQANAVFEKRIKISDTGAATSYKVNSPAGDYGILYAETSYDGDATLSTPMITGETIVGAVVTSVKPPAGLIFYQAGVAILSNKIFKSNHATATIITCAEAAIQDTKDFTLTNAAGVTVTFNFSGGKNISTNAGAYDATSDITVDIGFAGLASANPSATGDQIVARINAGTGINMVASKVGNNVLVIQGTAGTTGNTSITQPAGATGLTTPSAFTNGGTGLLSSNAATTNMNTAGNSISEMMSGSAISASCDALRQRMYNVEFNNTTELNSTVYFCRAHHNEFNYSTNPTYLSSSKLVVKNNASDTPVSYITTVGLYSADNELLACAKLSEPLKKDPSNELTLRVRLDY
tara:strand:- start:178 stop:1707 length:1530 start_codon:yes stop_codon:yes gene_type:complete